jgi:hypothetical protein
MFKELLQKLKDLFARIFKKNKLMLKEADNQAVTDVQTVPVENTVNSLVEQTPNTIEELKEENKRNQTVNEIIDMVEANPELMENLTEEQLDVIDEYYINANKKVLEEIDIMNEKISAITENIRMMDQQIAAASAE